MILVDTNILMYAAGAAHPHKHPSARLIDKVGAEDICSYDADLDVVEGLRRIAPAAI